MRGFVVASMDYRLRDELPIPSERVEALPANITFENSMNAAIDDTLTAIDWLFANSGTYHTDPTRVGVMGSSAGAVTAIHVAYTLDDYGIEAPAVGFVGSFFGGAYIPFWNTQVMPREKFPFELAANLLETGEAPLFLLHGSEDLNVEPERAQLLFDRAVEQYVPAEIHMVAGAAHGFGGFEDPPGPPFGIDPHVEEAAPGVTIFNRMVDWIHEVLPVQVEIDIRPWHSSNRIFPWYGIIPVAVFGSADFNVNDIDRATLKFGRDDGAAFPWALQGFNINPVDDNFDDLIVFFRASQSGIRCGDPVATLTGSTLSGDSFSGADFITTVGCF